MALSYGFCLGAAEAQDDARQLCEAFHALVGDGVCDYGDRFSLTSEGLTATLAPGFALVHGRWLRSDEPLSLTFAPSGNWADRYDAIVLQVEADARTVSLKILTDVSPAALRADAGLLRDKAAYGIVLYLVRIRRGATSLSAGDVTDHRGDPALCGYVAPMSRWGADILHIYRFLTSGIDEEVARLLGLSEAICQKADVAVADMEDAIQGVSPTWVGDITSSRFPPTPADAWLLCDGTSVPEAYPELYTVLGGVLPSLSVADSRFCSYIYSGPPVRRPAQ